MKPIFLFAILFLLTGLPSLAADVSGQWLFVMQTEGGERQISADLHVSGDQVTGKWDTAEIKGVFKDGKLNLSFPLTSHENGETNTLKIKGTLESDSISGTWEFGEYNGTYKATRKS